MVNTFIIADTPERCAQLLDYKRLGKQRVEGMQIITILEGKADGHSHHPVVAMWRDHIKALKYYTNCMIDEWIARGYKNTMSRYSMESTPITLPWWFTCKQLQLSHCCALLLKDPIYYNKIWNVTPDVAPYMKWGYLWPHKLNVDHETQLKAGKFLPPELVCAPLGSGIPAQYRLDPVHVKAWLLSPNINPVTKRRITNGGAIYRDYYNAAKALFP